MDHRRSFGMGIPGHKVFERTHRLGAQVAALGKMVIQHLPDSRRFSLPVRPIAVVHQGAEHGGVGHLAADEPGFHFGAAEEFAQFFLDRCFNLLDEGRPLVVVDLGIVKSSGLPMFRIAEGWVHDREESRHG